MLKNLNISSSGKKSDLISLSYQGTNPLNIDFVKTNISDNVSKFLLQKTAKRPIVIPVLLTI